MLEATVKKMKYDESYNFDHEVSKISRFCNDIILKYITSSKEATVR